MLVSGFKCQEGAESYEQRFWLEASTLSNRGEMRQHLPTDNDLNPYRWLEASTKTLNTHRSPLNA